MLVQGGTRPYDAEYILANSEQGDPMTALILRATGDVGPHMVAELAPDGAGA